MNRSLHKGLESLIAEMLRTHVVDAVFLRDEVRRNLPPERIEALRSEILERLARAEEEGRPDRGAVYDCFAGALASTGSAGTLVESLVREALARFKGPTNEGGGS
jgi:hypothetical protein